MTKPNRNAGRQWFAALLVLGLLVGPASWVVADEPPAEGPPPAAPKKAADDGAAKKDPPAWSPPAAPPAARADDSHLPPPVIRVRRRGARAAAPPPVSTRVRDVPSEIPAVRPAPPPPPPPAVRGGTTSTPVMPQVTTSTPGVQVVSMTKVHNVPRSDGSFALRLRVRYEVAGQTGKDIYLGAWFVRTADNSYVKSNFREHADPQGYVTVQTRPARVSLPKATYAATLEVPYAAFPVRAAGDEYEVEARILVLRHEPGSKMTVLAHGETTFKVHAAPAGETEEESPASSPPLLRGTALPTESGVIVD